MQFQFIYQQWRRKKLMVEGRRKKFADVCCMRRVNHNILFDFSCWRFSRIGIWINYSHDFLKCVFKFLYFLYGSMKLYWNFSEFSASLSEKLKNDDFFVSRTQLKQRLFSKILKLFERECLIEKFFRKWSYTNSDFVYVFYFQFNFQFNFS